MTADIERASAITIRSKWQTERQQLTRTYRGTLCHGAAFVSVVIGLCRR
jgi:hypothetical protein